MFQVQPLAPEELFDVSGGVLPYPHEIGDIGDVLRVLGKLFSFGISV